MNRVERHMSNGTALWLEWNGSGGKDSGYVNFHVWNGSRVPCGTALSVPMCKFHRKLVRNEGSRWFGPKSN
jgi:hypothetical protein